MRKKLKVVKEVLYEALMLLGYHKIKQYPSGSEWRRFRYHLIIRGEQKSRLTLHLHRDMPIPTPPFHKAVHNAPDVAAELQKILEAYKRRRAAK